MNQYLLSLGCIGLITYQLPILTVQAQTRTMSESNIIVAQKNNSKNNKVEVSTQPPNSQTTGYSRRRAIRYRFECNSNNQTVLAIYQARRNRSGNIVSSWNKMTDRPLIQWTEEGTAEYNSQLTSKERCQEVTAKFNYHFLRNESRPQLPPLSEGIVDKRPVVCAAPEGSCNQDNILWVVKNDNKNTNGQIIQQLLSSLRGEASSQLIMESQDEQEIEISVINMENIIDTIIEQESTKLEIDRESKIPEK